MLLARALTQFIDLPRLGRILCQLFPLSALLFLALQPLLLLPLATLLLATLLPDQSLPLLLALLAAALALPWRCSFRSYCVICWGVGVGPSTSLEGLAGEEATGGATVETRGRLRWRGCEGW